MVIGVFGWCVKLVQHGYICVGDLVCGGDMHREDYHCSSLGWVSMEGLDREW